MLCGGRADITIDATQFIFGVDAGIVLYRGIPKSFNFISAEQNSTEATEEETNKKLKDKCESVKAICLA